MKHWSLTLFTFLLITVSAAQDFSKSMNHAFLVTRMAEKFHIQPAPLDDPFSNRLFTLFLGKADPEKILFQADDLQQFNTYRLLLDDEIGLRKSGFLQLVYHTLQKRERENDSLIALILKTPFNVSIAETYTKAEDTSYAKTIADKKAKLYKHLKAHLLSEITEELPDHLTAVQQKRYADSVVKQLQLTLSKKYHQAETELTPEKLGQIFCNSIALCYDPHSVFFGAKEKESFDVELGQTPLRFGFVVEPNENGEPTIEKLLPGSSAFKSGAVNAGDKIIAVRVPGGTIVNTSEMDLLQVDSLLETITSEKLVFTFKKPDGTTREVTLFKERVESEEDEDDFVQGYILNGAKKIGYISIPDFYVDWENTQKGVNGCANDVAKEIIKLTKEKIDGLIIDLRYNGGGSLQEAMDLAGLFIDAGPVGLFKQKEPKVFTLKDMNSGSIYTGPLLILVNGYSASASEFFAAAMQDYNRALIVGSPTYGKSTGQIVFPLDTLVTADNPESRSAEVYVKITTLALYRVTGKTAQKNGVVPDVLLPDILQQVSPREADTENSFTLLPVEANKYFKPLPALNKEKISLVAKQIMDTSAYFRQVQQFEQWAKNILNQKEQSLKLEDRIRFNQEQQNFYTFFEEFKSNSNFTVQNHTLRKQRLQVSTLLTETDTETRELIGSDPYIKLCFELLLQITN